MEIAQLTRSKIYAHDNRDLVDNESLRMERYLADRLFLE